MNSKGCWYLNSATIRSQPVIALNKTDDAARQIEATIAELRDLKPSFVSVTYGAGSSTRERTIEVVTRDKRETGIEAGPPNLLRRVPRRNPERAGTAGGGGCAKCAGAAR